MSQDTYSEALVSAIAKNKVEVVNQLLTMKADANYKKGFFQMSPLASVVSGGYNDSVMPIVELLVEHKADVNERFAVDFQSVMDLSSQIGVQPQIHYFSPLSIAQDTDVLRYILLQKSNPNVPTIYENHEPLLEAASQAIVEQRDNHLRCQRQYARALMLADRESTTALASFFGCFVGLKRQIGTLLLVYYRAGVSEDQEFSTYSQIILRGT